MTILTTQPFNNWSGNGSSITFNFDFLVNKTSELVVFLDGDEAHPLVYGVDYSIHEFGNANGSYITFPLSGSTHSVLTDSEIISLVNSLPIKQESGFTAVPVLERTLDYIVRCLQIVNRKVERSIKTKEGSGVDPDVLVANLQASEVNAANSAAAASTSAASAATSATTAKTSEQNALISATKFNNLKTVNVIDFGAKGDGITDDYAAIKAALDFLNPLKDTMTTEEITNARNNYGGILYLPRGIYKHTLPIIIPTNVILEGEGSAFFRRANSSNQGTTLFYAPINLDTVGVMGAVYINNNDGTYSVNTDYNYLPSGTDFDNGVVTSVCSNIQIKNIAITTTDGVALGLRWVGCQGGSTDKISIGLNKVGGALNLKYGMLSCCSWGSVHNQPSIVANYQGLCISGSNGGLVFNQPYIDRNGSVNNDIATQLIPIQASLSTMSGGITISGSSSVTINEPIIENWAIPVSAYNTGNNVSVRSAHIEAYSGRIKYCFNIYAGSLNVNSFTGIAGLDSTSALFYFDTLNSNHIVNIQNVNLSLGYTLFACNGNGGNINLNGIPNALIIYGKLGSYPANTVISNVINTVVYVNYTNGDDSNFGLNTIKPVKNLSKAIALARLYGIKYIQITDIAGTVIPISSSINCGMKDDGLYIGGINAIALDFASGAYLYLGDNTTTFKANLGFSNITFTSVAGNSRIFQLDNGFWNLYFTNCIFSGAGIYSILYCQYGNPIVNVVATTNTFTGCAPTVCLVNTATGVYANANVLMNGCTVPAAWSTNPNGTRVVNSALNIH